MTTTGLTLLAIPSLNSLFWSAGLERDGSGPQTAIIGLGWSDKVPGLVLAA
jgi:hypothetical protein